jgi:dipeptidyl aminopeptidase/acylaminoacyl peptidase
MRTSHLSLTLLVPALLSAQGTAADYQRSTGLRQKYQGLLVDAPEAPNWIDSTSRFWYRKAVRGGNQFVLVDATTGTKAPAFDHQRLATSLGTATGRTYTAITLPFTAITFADGGRRIDVTVDSGGFGCTLADYACSRRAGAGGRGGRGGPPQGAGGRGGGGPAGGNDSTRVSPDGRSTAIIQNFNVWVRAAGRAAEPLSFDGSEGNPYTLNSIQWSPDSKKIAAYRVKPGYQRMVRYVESSPTDQVQPKTFERFYAKPGDVLDLRQPSLFDVASKKEVVIDNTLFPNPYNLSAIEWRKSSRAFTFEYNERGHQRYRVIEVDATTGAPRALITETSSTFIDYRRANGGLTDSGRQWRFDVNDGAEMIWMSEKDGWAHLYLHDANGALKQQITKGQWLVRGVQRVDEAKRQIWFSAAGMNPKEDPYHSHFYRINFDGTGLTQLTPAEGNHAVTFSANNEFYVDTWSSVGAPPVSELRRSSDQQLVTALEKADASALAAAGWKPPEVFTAKARDGKTDIWGVIFRPSNLDPAKKYPVIENIYAGPQGSFVPKNFVAFNAMQALAEIGFIVVQVDGMGTANRSKAFHDVAWKNLGDAGFADRILWHRAINAKYPYYDITRVGVYGTSAGGQNSLGALLYHPEFYKAAVSAAGCHDNRMDKVWWNEQWMGWPIGPEYAASSNVVMAPKLQGKLLLVVGELDTNVDPSSTYQVVNALIKSNKMFDLLMIPGAGHTSGGPYGERKRDDFFVHHLLGVEPPDRNVVPIPAGGGDDDDAWELSWEGMWHRWIQGQP